MTPDAGNRRRGKKPLSILVVRLSAIGDVVHTLPAVRYLRSTLPEGSTVAYMTQSAPARLLEGHPDIDELHVVPLERWRKTLRETATHALPCTIRTLAREASRILGTARERSYDIVLDMHGNLKSALAARFSAGASSRLMGFHRSSSKELNHLFMREEVIVEPGGVPLHRSLKYLNLARAAVEGAPPCEDAGMLERWLPPPPLLGSDEGSRRAVERFLAEWNGFDGEGPLVVLHAGTSEYASHKRWPAARFGETATRLADAYPHAAFLFTGTIQERPLVEEALSAVAARHSRRAAVAPEGDLKMLAALLERADLVISADTAPLHIAHALGTPVVALFGPKDERIYAPCGKKAEVVTADVPCRPCRKRACRNPICMSSIEAGWVFNAAGRLLDGRK